MIHAASRFVRAPTHFTKRRAYPLSRVALLAIRRLSVQPRYHRYVDRVALGEPHAQVDHLFRALVGDLHSAALGIAQTIDLGFCLAQHRGSAFDLASRLEAERGSLGVQSLHQIGHGSALPYSAKREIMLMSTA